MATPSELQKLNESITKNLESIAKQINEIKDKNAKYEENFKKIFKREDSHEQALGDLAKVMRRIEIANEKQNNEFKMLAQELHICAQSETVYTEPANVITDDETASYTGKTTQKISKPRDSTTRRETSREDSMLKPTDALRMVENLNGINDIGVEEFIKSENNGLC
ncbi:hypothetical protein K0M31_015996 [Melipona bicolor]|uniref:Uncharacterized protein n=1 Tax=Melipona bicolor TaxID=60889 RepID=A0AA40KTA5_9HYME|nr:hypothetical protein K0M31_015996 [Melipona bicolor]